MKNYLALLDRLPWGVVLILCATLGLAPFTPPHIVEKLSLLASGRLVRPIDWFDLFLHGAPWLLLMFKLAVTTMGTRQGPE